MPLDPTRRRERCSASTSGRRSPRALWSTPTGGACSAHRARAAGAPRARCWTASDTVQAAVERGAGVRAGEVLACSSAGGGLRIAVVGYERLVTAEAGRRVALSAGGRVVHVHAGPLATPDVAALRAAAARTSSCSRAARTAATRRCCWPTRAGSRSARLRAPVVVAGNAEAAPDAGAELDRPRPHAWASRPTCCRGSARWSRCGARAAIRELFLRARHRRQGTLPRAALRGGWSGPRRRTPSSPASRCSRP